ncbi:mitochondrial thiamine pyrophosphate carrier 1 [Monosporozyma unispora]|nr:mitochondrial thiamine pyrophosphate transporter [Kazachstania unispora]
MSHPDHLRKGTNTSVVHSLIAGSLSGLVARIMTAPLDTIKIRLQITPSSGLTQTTKDIILKEGIKSLWKGNVPGSMMYVIYGGTQFGSYSMYNEWLAPLDLSGQLHSLVVGMMSGLTSSFISYPFDTLRTRFVANRGSEFFPLKQACVDIWEHEGFKGFYGGCTTSLVSLTVATGIMFSTYESIKIYSEGKHGDATPILSASASTISAITSKTLTFPIDTVRRRIQLQDSIHMNKFFQMGNNLELYKRYQAVNNILMIPVLMIRYEGIHSLYKGLFVALCKSIPTTVLSLWTYERIMSV